MTIIPALRGLTQKDQKFIASLGYIEKWEEKKRKEEFIKNVIYSVNRMFTNI